MSNFTNKKLKNILNGQVGTDGKARKLFNNQQVSA